MKASKVPTGKKFNKKNPCIKMDSYWTNQPVSSLKLKNSNLFDTLFIYNNFKFYFLFYIFQYSCVVGVL